MTDNNKNLVASNADGKNLEIVASHLDISALQESTRRLSEMEDILVNQLNKPRVLGEFLHLVEAFQRNAEAIRKQTLALHSIRIKELGVNDKIIDSSGWESL